MTDSFTPPRVKPITLIHTAFEPLLGSHILSTCANPEWHKLALAGRFADLVFFTFKGLSLLPSLPKLLVERVEGTSESLFLVP